jgi:hypothetical protein
MRRTARFLADAALFVGVMKLTAWVLLPGW